MIAKNNHYCDNIWHNKQKTTTTTYVYKNEDRIYSFVKEVDEEMESSFEDRNVCITEKIHGQHIRIVFDGKDVSLHSKIKELINDDEYYGARKLFKEGFELPYALLKEKLFNIPFILYGQLVSSQTQSDVTYISSNSNKPFIIFHDIYINTNWMNWDDFSKICAYSGLIVVPLLYDGVYNKSIVKDLIKRKSTVSYLSEQPIAGIIIKPRVEDEYRNTINSYTTTSRLIGKIYNPKFKPNSKLVLSQPVKKVTKFVEDSTTKHPATIVHEFLDKVCNRDNISAYWVNILKDKEIEINVKNLNKIINTIAVHTWNLMADDLFIECISYTNDYESAFKLVKKEFGKQLPWRIKYILDLYTDMSL